MVFCNLFRLLRIPNADPIMGCMLPFAKQGKWWQAALFSFITMLSFDLITTQLGIWTVITAGTYASLGLFFHFIYKNRRVSLPQYLVGGLSGVLLFDVITGVIFAPILFGMSFEQAFFGQIPFTLLHLASVGIFTILITPVLDKTIIGNSVLEDEVVWNKVIKQAILK